MHCRALIDQRLARIEQLGILEAIGREDQDLRVGNAGHSYLLGTAYHVGPTDRAARRFRNESADRGLKTAYGVPASPARKPGEPGPISIPRETASPIATRSTG